MKLTLVDIQEQYAVGLSDYLAGKGEGALQQAYELGRNAIVEGYSFLDLLKIHEETIGAFLEDSGQASQSVEMMTSATQFLAEVLSPFEMTHRGFRDAIEELKERASQLTTINSRLEAEISDRIEAERRLSNSERMYRSLFDTARDFIYTLSADGVITSLNPAAESLMGWERSAWIGKYFAPLVHPDDLALAAGEFGKVLAGEVSDVFEVRVRTKGGEYLVVECITTPQLHEGRVVGMLGIARDITSRKRAEEQLRQNEEQFRLITENIADLVVMLDTDGHVIYNSPSYRSLIGFSASDQNADAFQNIHPDDRERVRNIFYEMVKTGKGLRAEYRFISGNKTIRYIESEGSVIRDSNGNTEKVIVVSRDITERKVALEKLKVHEKQLADAQQMAHIGSWEWDIGANKILWSDELYRIYGFSREEFTGAYETYIEKIHPDDRNFVRKTIEESLHALQPFRFEHRILSAGGTVRFVEARGEVITDDEKKPVKLIGTSQDITERKKADEAVRALAKRVVEAQEEERKRIARELHDNICQRLSAIKLQMGVLEEDVPDKRTGLFKQLQKMKSQVGGTINEVRGISANLRPTTLDDLGLVTALQLLCREFEKTHGIEISFTARGVEKSMLDIHRETALYRIAQEALANVANHADAKKAALDVYADDSVIAMSIQDNGKGFDPAKLPQRKDRSGFGLMNMKERSLLLGGTFQITSSRGKGTTLFLKIPLATG